MPRGVHKRNPNKPQSATLGVSWDAKNSKWQGAISNPLKRTASGGKEYRCTERFVNEADCIAATNALRKKVDDKYWAHCTLLAEADPLTRGLPRGPDEAADAEPKTLYWRPSQKNGHKPHRVARTSAGILGFVWVAACQHGQCTNVAKQAIKGGPREFCQPHGGHCPHGHQLSKCRNCNPNVTKMMSNCSSCGDMIGGKRVKSKGGNGLCAMCEAQSAPPPSPSKKQKTVAPRVKQYEEKMLSMLILSGYTESFNKGVAPRPGEFTREVYFDYRCVKGTEFKGDEKKYAYVDFVVNPHKGGKLVYLEVDENMHKGPNYNVLCDTTRMWNTVTSVGFDSAKQQIDWSLDVNVMWLRVNPDVAFKIGNTTHNPSSDARCTAVCKLIDGVEGHADDPKMSVHYCFYNMDENCNPTLLQDPDYHGQVKDGVRRVRHTMDADGAWCVSLE
jgi:hypothetical protein